MPIYEYACVKCGFKEDILEKIDGPKVKVCPHCGGDAFTRPEVSPAAFHLKGGGWYKDGYSSSSPKTESTKSESTKSDAVAADTKPADKKPDSTSGSSGAS